MKKDSLKKLPIFRSLKHFLSILAKKSSV